MKDNKKTPEDRLRDLEDRLSVEIARKEVCCQEILRLQQEIETIQRLSWN